MPAAMSSSFGLSLVRPKRETCFLAAPQRRLPVWGSDGVALGELQQLVIDKASGRIVCALVGRNGFAARHIRHSLPWSLLEFDERLRAYRAETTQPTFCAGPRIRRRDLADVDLMIWKAGTYYGVGG
jgi:hypothetical protein